MYIYMWNIEHVRKILVDNEITRKWYFGLIVHHQNRLSHIHFGINGRLQITNFWKYIILVLPITYKSLVSCYSNTNNVTKSHKNRFLLSSKSRRLSIVYQQMRANIWLAFKQITNDSIDKGFWFGYSKCRDIWQMTNQGL